MVGGFANWNVAIRLYSVHGNALAGLRAIAGGATLASQRTAILQRQINAVSGALRTGLSVAALAGADALFNAVKGAAQLQQSMTNVQIATRATRDEMRALTDAAFNVSRVTQQSVQDSANLLAVMSRSGLTASQTAQLANPVAKFADILYSQRQVPFTEGATEGVTLAHLFRRYGTSGKDDIRPILDMAGLLAQKMPHGLDKALTQMTYFAPNAQTLGVDPAMVFASMAMLDRTGYGRGKGGTNIADLLMASLGPLELTKHMQDAKAGLLGMPNKKHPNALGLLDAHGNSIFYTQDPKTGKWGYDLIGLFNKLYAYANGTDPETGHARRGDQVSKIFKSAFGIQGSRIANLMMDKAVTSQVGALREQFAHSAGFVNWAQFRIMQNMIPQWNRLVTDFKSFLAVIGTPFLDKLRDSFSHAADDLERITDYLRKHPRVNDAAAGALLWGTVAAGAGALLSGAGFVKSGIGALLGGSPAAVAKAVGAGGSPWGKIAGTVGGGLLGAMSLPHLRGALGALGRFHNAQWAELSGGVNGAFMKGALMDMPGAGAVAGFFALIGRAAAPLVAIGARIGMMFGGLFSGLLAFGSKAIPIVGEIMLVIQAMQLFAAHAHDIGWVLGRVSAWMIKTGVPMISNAFVTIVKMAAKAIWEMAAWVVKGLWNSFIGVFNGFHGGIWDTLRQLSAGFQQGFSAGDKVTVTVQKSGAGGGKNGGGGTNVHFHYHAPAGGNGAMHKRVAAKEHRDMAKKTAAIFSGAARSGSLGAGRPSIAGASSFESQSGMA